MIFDRFDVLKKVLPGFAVAAVAGCGVLPDEPGQDTDEDATTGDVPIGTTTADPDSGSATSGGTDGSSGSAESSGETGEPADPIDPYDTEVVWTPCPLYTGGGGRGAECAEIQLPTDWYDHDGGTLTMFVKRIGNPDGDKQLWMLMGGPGAAGAGYEGTAETFVDADDQLVVYLPDHRGVGRSSRLGCPVQESPASPSGLSITPGEWPDCIDDLVDTWGDDLAHFSTTQAAFDLAWLVDELRADQAVHVFGGSYGTYWGHRYVQLYPEQADSLSLLGIAPPDFNFARFTEQYDDAGRRFMGECSADPSCSSRLGPDAEATMEVIMDAVDQGLCPEALAAGLDRDTLKLYFSSLLSWTWDERVLVPAILFRLQRCNAEDAVALQNAAPLMMDPLAGLLDDPLFSRVINMHVSLSEMWHPPIPTVEEAQQAAEDALFGLGSSETRVAIAESWPTYPHDEYVLEYAETDLPMLMIVGEYDPNSPLELGIDFGENFDGPQQHFLTIPGGSHGWDSPTTEGYGCAINVFFNFIQDPTQPLLDCMGIVEPIDFAGPPGLAQAFFGTMDLYDN